MQAPLSKTTDLHHRAEDAARQSRQHRQRTDTRRIRQVFRRRRCGGQEQVRQGGGSNNQPRKYAVKGGVHNPADPGEKSLPPPLPLVIALVGPLRIVGAARDDLVAERPQGGRPPAGDPRTLVAFLGAIYQREGQLNERGKLVGARPQGKLPPAGRRMDVVAFLTALFDESDGQNNREHLMLKSPKGGRPPAM